MLEANAPIRVLAAKVDDFLSFFQSDMSPHFREEDEIVVPRAEHAAPDVALVARAIRAEHIELRTAIEALRTARSSPTLLVERLRHLIEWIPNHVRDEEERLFEGLQSSLDADELKDMGNESAAFRKKHRSPSASGPKSGRRGSPP